MHTHGLCFFVNIGAGRKVSCMPAMHHSNLHAVQDQKGLHVWCCHRSIPAFHTLKEELQRGECDNYCGMQLVWHRQSHLYHHF